MIKELTMGKKSQRPKSSRKQNDQDKQDSSNLLPGWPGHRTRDGRSGYDPIDTRTEADHTAGTMIQKLFTGEITKPLFLFLSAVLGLILIIPLFFAISEIRNGNVLPWNAWIFLLITGSAGIVILINFIKNLIEMITRQEGLFPHIKSPEEDE
jgi:hypothetical protein